MSKFRDNEDFFAAIVPNWESKQFTISIYDAADWDSFDARTMDEKLQQRWRRLDALLPRGVCADCGFPAKPHPAHPEGCDA